MPALPRKADLELRPALSAQWPDDGMGPIVELAAQIPEPATLGSGALIAIHPSPAPSNKLLARLFSGQRRRAHAAVRCSALLLRGYVDIGADDASPNDGMVWGVAP